MDGERQYVFNVKHKTLVINDDEFLPAKDVELTDKEREKARLKLGETEEKKNECLQKLRQQLLRT